MILWKQNYKSGEMFSVEESCQGNPCFNHVSSLVAVATDEIDKKPRLFWKVVGMIMSRHKNSKI